MSDLFYVEVQVEPCVRPCEVIKDAWTAIQKGLKKNDGKSLFCFKVTGENRLLVVMQGDPDDPLEELNAVCGSKVRVTTNPLRKYEEFCEKVLKMEDKTLTNPPPFSLDGEGKLLLLHAKVDYKGMTQKEMLDLWRVEANQGLAMLNPPGKFALYKFVGQREVIAFIRTLEYGSVDDLFYSLPLYVGMGNQIDVSVKALRMLEPGK